MSDDDLLERATKALRERGEPDAADLRRLRARVTEGVRGTQRRRSRVWTAAFPIAAVLVATTAWAAGTGRLDAAFRGVRALFGPEAAVSAPPVASGAPVASGSHVPAPASSSETEAVANEPVANEPVAKEAASPSVTSPAPSASAAPHPSAAAKPEIAKPEIAKPEIAKPEVAKPEVAASTSPTEVEEDGGGSDLALYRRAHELHFVQKDPAAALAAWDAYLQGSPGGAFVAEARWNRAICLVKLGRKAEAKSALAPFAEGKIAGGYRKQEAADLIEALEAP